tara:strand:- start:775 stop:996 length:222 start_codon:yes stop_codon:yes gene_type:complete
MDESQVNGLNIWLEKNMGKEYTVNEHHDKGKYVGIRAEGTQWVMVKHNGELTNMFITVDFYLKQVVHGLRALY